MNDQVNELAQDELEIPAILVRGNEAVAAEVPSTQLEGRPEVADQNPAN